MPKSKYSKDEKGLYYASVPTGELDSRGYKKYKRIRAKTIAALDEKLAQYNIDIALNLDRTKLTMEEWYYQWIATYKASCKQTTKNWYAGIYKRHISPILGKKQLSTIKETHCQGILAAMESSSQQTQRAVRITMYSLLNTAERNRLIAYNPARFIKIGGKPPKKRRSLTQEEREAYLQVCKTHPFGTFAAFLFYLGLRRGECLALTTDDIKQDFIVISKQYTFPGNNAPMLSAPKTAAGVREIPIPNGLRPFIAKCKCKNGLVFSTEDGFPLSYSKITDGWKSFILEALGSDTDITMHYIRHNYCTMLFEQGVDILTAQHLMGHDDSKTTMQIYAHYTDTLKAKNQVAILQIGMLKEAE